MRWITVLDSETGLTLLAGVLGAVWTLFKSSDWYMRSKERRYTKAMQALEAGVYRTYQSYVRAIKTARHDGRLTEQEKRCARRLACETAIELGLAKGVDVMRELGNEYLDLFIAKMVTQLKQEA